MWVPPEDKDPVLFHAPTRKSVAVFGAVRINDGRLCTLQEPIFNSTTFLAFLKKVLRYRMKGEKIVLILDNARYHRAKDIQPWLESHKSLLKLEFLPAYSPELNPIERVWRLTRRLCVHNRYFPTLEYLMETVSSQFKLWRKPNDILSKLCAII